MRRFSLNEDKRRNNNISTVSDQLSSLQVISVDALPLAHIYRKKGIIFPGERKPPHLVFIETHQLS